ncbi:MAG TPA: hypothetical protein VLI06_15460 [Solimonas sp.]|nr:hypothetical protein [Solimonas sp.]
MATTPHASFLRYERYRYLKFASLLCLLSIVAYWWHEPQDGPNGGTWLGYTLGTIGALLIVWLAWLGVRKRRYSSTLGTVKGWLSAHVYLGLALLTIATLHTGFQFGWNIHTVAFVLMAIVVLSGIFGIAAYARLPTLITENMGDADRETLIDEILDLNQQSLKIADLLGPEVHRIISRSTERIRIGGGLRDQLFRPLPQGRGLLDELRRVLADKQRAAAAEAYDPDSSSTVIFMAGEMAQARKSGDAAEKARQLMELISRRNALITRVNRDIQLHAQMQIWLYFHVPLSIALLAALVAHIVSVFLYW